MAHGLTPDEIRRLDAAGLLTKREAFAYVRALDRTRRATQQLDLLATRLHRHTASRPVDVATPNRRERRATAAWQAEQAALDATVVRLRDEGLAAQADLQAHADRIDAIIRANVADEGPDV